MSGFAALGLGILFYLLEIPIVFLWSFPFMAGGLIFILIGLLVKESELIELPAGERFCPFCSSSVFLGMERCENCNGLQP